MASDSIQDTPGKFAWFRKILPHRSSAAPASRGQSGRFWPSRKQFGFLPTILQPWERWTAGILLFMVVGSGGTLLVRFIGNHMVAYPRAGGSYTEAVVGEPQFINPVLARSSDVDLDLTHLLFRGLFRIDEQGQVANDLATHVEVSQDQKTYIITLEQDARWHDGEPITASDVMYTFDLIRDPETQSPYLKTFKDLQLELVDERTVKMTLAEPYAPFLSSLTIGILPEHIWSDIPSTNLALAEYNLKPIGSGPFQFQSLTKDRMGSIKSYKIIRSPQYTGKKPYLNDITFRFYGDQQAAVDALRRHKAQGISTTTHDELTIILKEPVSVHELHLPQYTAVFYNQKNAVLKDKQIRIALAQAVDKKAIIEKVLFGTAESISTPILPGFLGHNSDVKDAVFNIAAAQKTLDDAGWKLPDGAQVRKKGDQELKFSITTVDRPDYTEVAEMLKQAWKTIGAGVDIRTIASSDILKKTVKPRAYDALLFGEIIGNDPDPYPFWHSSQGIDPGLNLSVYVNKKVDGLLEDARQTSDAEKRRLDYLEFQNILAEDRPALFLYNPLYFYALPKKMRGFINERVTVPSDRFDGVTDWYLKTRSQWQWGTAHK